MVRQPAARTRAPMTEELDGRLGALRLVFVTPGRDTPAATIRLVEQVVDGGVTAVLLREPQLSATEVTSLAAEVVSTCRAAGVLALVSRDLDLVDEVDADGVHLGWGGPSVNEARTRLPGRLVGRSGHWPLETDDTLADYLTLSPFRPTARSHPRPLLTKAQIESVVRRPGLGPVIALGGLTAAQIPELPEGLSGVAVIRALTDATDPRAAAAVLRSAMDSYLDFGNPEIESRALR
jgi:thiamine-phosphate pyrophosphorylase